MLRPNAPVEQTLAYRRTAADFIEYDNLLESNSVVTVVTDYNRGSDALTINSTGRRGLHCIEELSDADSSYTDPHKSSRGYPKNAAVSPAVSDSASWSRRPKSGSFVCSAVMSSIGTFRKLCTSSSLRLKTDYTRVWISGYKA